jgi:hypothetical protein
MDEDEPDPWGFGTIGTAEEHILLTEQEVALIMAKKMSCIGFYENKEQPNAVHDKRKKGLQKGKRAV